MRLKYQGLRLFSTFCALLALGTFASAQQPYSVAALLQVQTPPVAAPAAAAQDPDPVELPKDPAQLKDMQNDIKVGKDYAAELEKSLKFSKNTEQIERLQHVGGIIAKIARHNQVSVSYGDTRLFPFNYTFRLIQGDDVNAFSIPGGTVYVYEGLMNFVESDDELAAVLAHECSHAAFRHYATTQKKSTLINALALPLLLTMILSRSDAAIGAAMIGQNVSQAYESKWSVQAEEAADFGSVQFMAKSPYQPVAMLTFMERLAERDDLTSRPDWTIYTTHPPSQDRARTVYQKLVAQGSPIRRSLVTRSLSAHMETKPDGSVPLYFGKTLIYTFKNSSAATSASLAVSRLDDFFDQVPEMYMVEIGEGGAMLGNGRELFRVTGATPEAVAADQQEAYQGLRKAVFDVGLRVSLSRNGAMQ